MFGAAKQQIVRVARVARPGNRWRYGDGRFAMYWHAGEPNFGDVLSPLILGAHLPGEPRWASATFAAKVVGLGSVAHTISAGDLVLGTGSIDGAPQSLPTRTRVLAVRGPRTAKALGLRGEVAFGDPGLLAADGLAPTADVAPIPGRIALIAHHSHSAALAAELPGIAHDRDRIEILDLHGDPQAVMDGIAAAETVVSSALHGIIAAEALGTPAIWFELGDPLIGGRFKFHDHQEAMGRTASDPIDLATALAAAERGDAEAAPVELDGIRSALTEAAELLH